MIYIGIGPTTNRYDNYMVCIFLKQDLGSMDVEDWQLGGDFSQLYPTSPTTHFNLSLGLGMEGNMSNFYITSGYLKLPSVFRTHNLQRNDHRDVCYSTIHEKDPFWISEAACGNGVLEGTEVWDDGDIDDGDGWNKTWAEEHKFEWYVTSFNYTRWTLRWGNARLESSHDEYWDDGNRSNKDGWSNVCAVEPGYDWDSVEGAKTTWTPIWGDLMRVSREVWDDNDINDGRGCRDDWTAPLQGWIWDNSSPTSWTHVINDGIRAVNAEDWDDGNSDENDGWTTSGLIDPLYTWEDNIVGTSIWKLRCGNGRKDHSDELWDDANNIDNDGWSSTWKIEPSYYWNGGTISSADTWAKSKYNI